MKITERIDAITDERVRKKIRISSSGCFEYMGAITSAGYGCVRRKKKSLQAHRYVWELVNGTIPDGLHMLHKCDNKKCVNPDHLFLGTHLDNMRDAISKGRHNSSGLKLGYWGQIPPKGEDSGMAKLSNSDVDKIKVMVSGDHIKQKDVALLFHVSRAQVSRIVNNLSRAM